MLLLCWRLWLFLKSAELFLLCSEGFRFSLVGLEMLPGPLREHVLNFQLKVSSEKLPVNVNYMLASGHDALLGPMSWMGVVRMQEANLLTAAEAAAQVDSPHMLHCFCGLAGSGKSHSMALRAASRAQVPVSMTIGERTSAADVLACLSKAVAEAAATPQIQISVSSYANFGWLDQLFYQLLVAGVSQLLGQFSRSFLVWQHPLTLRSQRQSQGRACSRACLLMQTCILSLLTSSMACCCGCLCWQTWFWEAPRPTSHL